MAERTRNHNRGFKKPRRRSTYSATNKRREKWSDSESEGESSGSVETHFEKLRMRESTMDEAFDNLRAQMAVNSSIEYYVLNTHVLAKNFNDTVDRLFKEDWETEIVLRKGFTIFKIKTL